MAFVSSGLPNNGSTTHFQVYYDDSLPLANGFKIANQLMDYCEDDFALLQSWFVGIGLSYSFPIHLRIAKGEGGAGWSSAPLLQPTVDFETGTTGDISEVRFLFIAEVSEMFMFSSGPLFGQPWFGAFKEGSKGEALSDFLASKFFSTTKISKQINPIYLQATLWINDPTRPNYVDVATEDIAPNSITGCGTCFLFYLHEQLGFSIQEIISAGADTLANVYKKLTGRTDGWHSFKTLVDLHFPLYRDLYYSPPLDNIFVVPNLSRFFTKDISSWVTNDFPNRVYVELFPESKVKVRIHLSSDDPSVISLPDKVDLKNSEYVPLTIKPQASGFISKVVNLTATYAGKTIITKVKVVPPKDLPVPPLVIEPLSEGLNSCDQRFVEGTAQTFIIKNPSVIQNRNGLTYQWKVVGAFGQSYTSSTLVIPNLPVAGTKIEIEVAITNFQGIQATGKFTFITVQLETGIREDIRRINCMISKIKAINKYIPPNVPVESIENATILQELDSIESKVKEMFVSTKNVLTTLRATKAKIKSIHD